MMLMMSVLLALLGLCGAERDVDVAVLRVANEATDHLLSSTSALLVAFLDFNEKFPYNSARYIFDSTEWEREGEGRESNNYGSSSSGSGSGHSSGSGQESGNSLSRIERQLALMRANMTLPGGLCEEARFYLDSVVSDREVRGVEGVRAVLRTVRGLVRGVAPIGEASARVVQALSATVENGASGMVWYTPTIGEALKVAGRNGESLWDDCGLCGWPRGSLQPSMCARENPREHPEIVFQSKLGQLRSGSLWQNDRPLTIQLTAFLGAIVSLKDSLRAIERTLAVAAPAPVPSDGGPGSGPQAASATAAAPTSAPSDGGQGSQVPVPHSRAPAPTSSTPVTESSKMDGSRTSGSSGAGLWLGLLLVVVLLFVGGVYLLRLRNQAHFGAVINGATA